MISTTKRWVALGKKYSKNPATPKSVVDYKRLYDSENE